MKAIGTKYCENASLYPYLSWPPTRSHLSHAVLYFHLWPVRVYQSISLKGSIFWKKNEVIEHKIVSIFSTVLSKTFLILRRIQLFFVTTVQRSSCKLRVILFRFQWNFNFIHRFSENSQISNFMKILPVGAELFHADRRTDRHDEANRRFSKFYERAQ